MENLIESPWNTTDERLRKTFSAALIFHFILLDWCQLYPALWILPSLSMEVTLAHYKSEEAPDECRFYSSG